MMTRYYDPRTLPDALSEIRTLREIARSHTLTTAEIQRLTIERDALQSKWLSALTSSTGAYIPTYLERMDKDLTDKQAMRAEAIDLRAALAERDVKITVQHAEIEKLTAERDAKIAALEKQEPVGVVAQDDDGIFVDFHHWPIDGLQIGSDVYAAAGAAPVPEGWQLVPVEPTQEMLGAMQSSGWLPGCYKTMLAAAPKEPTP